MNLGTLDAEQFLSTDCSSTDCNYCVSRNSFVSSVQWGLVISESTGVHGNTAIAFIKSAKTSSTNDIDHYCRIFFCLVIIPNY